MKIRMNFDALHVESSFFFISIVNADKRLELALFNPAMQILQIV